MIPGVLAWALGSMELAFAKRGKTERGAGFFSVVFVFVVLFGLGYLF